MNPLPDEVRIVVLIGTNRPGSYTAKAARLVIDELQRRSEVTVEVVDLGAMELAFPGHEPTPDRARLQKLLEHATGVVIATPEYHGSFAAALKLAIENMGFPSGLAGKPVALLGVAAGAIGAVKSLEQLRGVCSHVGALVLPGSVSVAGVQKVFDEDGRCRDPKVEERVRGLAGSLVDYIGSSICPRLALERQVREGG